MFQLIVYPIFDVRHYICAMFPMVYLILKRINSRYLLKIIGISVYCLEMILLYIYVPSINFDKNVCFLRNSGQLELFAEEVIDYVDGNENFYFTDYYNYLIKLYGDIPIGQYDLLLSGNVGYKGMNKKFDELTELCSKEKCYFFSKDVSNLSEREILVGQYLAFYEYIRKNYVKVDSLFEFDIYTNFVE